MPDDPQRWSRDSPPMVSLAPSDVARLASALQEARSVGVLGPMPVAEQIAHSIGFAALDSGSLIRTAADLGAGAGVPGAVLAVLWPDVSFFLIESSRRRVQWLERLTEDLGLTGRVVVLADRAERLGHVTGVRESLDRVFARSFGAPAVVAECAAPLLKVGGIAVVAEPPVADDKRWDPASLALLGLELLPRYRSNGFNYRPLAKVTPCPARYPRRVGIPSKRPLF
ncbi:MAG: RsmG family class I SAM-dependent methyltransferase [Acidimicrobiales bacterium]